MRSCYFLNVQHSSWLESMDVSRKSIGVADLFFHLFLFFRLFFQVLGRKQFVGPEQQSLLIIG